MEKWKRTEAWTSEHTHAHFVAVPEVLKLSLLVRVFDLPRGQVRIGIGALSLRDEGLITLLTLEFQISSGELQRGVLGTLGGRHVRAFSLVPRHAPIRRRGKAGKHAIIDA